MNELARSRSLKINKNESLLKAPPLKYKECQIFLSPITLYSIDTNNKLRSNIQINKIVIDDIKGYNLEKEEIKKKRDYMENDIDIINTDKRRSSILDKLEESYKKHGN